MVSEVVAGDAFAYKSTRICEVVLGKVTAGTYSVIYTNCEATWVTSCGAAVDPFTKSIVVPELVYDTL